MKQADYEKIIYIALFSDKPENPIIKLLSTFKKEETVSFHSLKKPVLAHQKLASELLSICEKEEKNNKGNALLQVINLLNKYETKLNEDDDFTALLKAFFSFFPEYSSLITNNNLACAMKVDYSWIENEFKNDLNVSLEQAQRIEKIESGKSKYEMLNATHKLSCYYDLADNELRHKAINYITQAANHDPKLYKTLSDSKLLTFATTSEKEKIFKALLTLQHDKDTYYKINDYKETIGSILQSATEEQKKQFLNKIVEQLESTEYCNHIFAFNYLTELTKLEWNKKQETQIIQYLMNSRIKGNREDCIWIGLHQMAKRLSKEQTLLCINEMLNHNALHGVSSALCTTFLSLLENLSDDQKMNIVKKLFSLIGNHDQREPPVNSLLAAALTVPVLKNEIIDQLIELLASKAIIDKTYNEHANFIASAVRVASPEQQKKLVDLMVGLFDKHTDIMISAFAESIHFVNATQKIDVLEKMFDVLSDPESKYANNACKVLAVALSSVENKMKERIIKTFMGLLDTESLRERAVSGLAIAIATKSFSDSESDKIYNDLLKLQHEYRCSHVGTFLPRALRLSLSSESTIAIDKLLYQYREEYNICVNKSSQESKSTDEFNQQTLQRMYDFFENHVEENYLVYHYSGNRCKNEFLQLYFLSRRKEKTKLQNIIINDLTFPLRFPSAAREIIAIAKTLSLAEQVSLIRDIKTIREIERFSNGKLLAELIQIHLTQKRVENTLQDTAGFPADIAHMVAGYAAITSSSS